MTKLAQLAAALAEPPCTKDLGLKVDDELKSDLTALKDHHGKRAVNRLMRNALRQLAKEEIAAIRPKKSAG